MQTAFDKILFEVRDDQWLRGFMTSGGLCKGANNGSMPNWHASCIINNVVHMHKDLAVFGKWGGHENIVDR